MAPLHKPFTHEQLMAHLRPWSFAIEGIKGVQICPVSGTDDAPRYAVRKDNDTCLNNEGQWEYEPLPSSRTHDFLQRCRYDSIESTVAAIEKLLNPQPESTLGHTP